MQSEHLCGFDCSLLPSWEITVPRVIGISTSVAISQFPTFLLVEEVVAPSRSFLQDILSLPAGQSGHR